MDSRLYAAHQLFKQIGYPFEWLKLSVKKKWSAVQTAPAVYVKKKLSSVWVAWAICSKKLSAVWMARAVCAKKKLFSVGTAQAIRWKKLSAIRTARAICSKKIGSRSKARSSYLFEEEFCWVSIPEQLPHQLLVSNDLLFSMSSWVVPLRTLFTNVSWIVTVLFLPLPHLFVIHSAIPFRTAWLPRPHLLACCVFVYRALFIRNIFEWEVTYLKWMELLWNNCTIHCTIHCSYWNNLYQNDFVFNNQLMMG